MRNYAGAVSNRKRLLMGATIAKNALAHFANGVLTARISSG